MVVDTPHTLDGCSTHHARFTGCSPTHAVYHLCSHHTRWFILRSTPLFVPSPPFTTLPPFDYVPFDFGVVTSFTVTTNERYTRGFLRVPTHGRLLRTRHYAHTWYAPRWSHTPHTRRSALLLDARTLPHTARLRLDYLISRCRFTLSCYVSCILPVTGLPRTFRSPFSLRFPRSTLHYVTHDATLPATLRLLRYVTLTIHLHSTTPPPHHRLRTFYSLPHTTHVRLHTFGYGCSTRSLPHLPLRSHTVHTTHVVWNGDLHVRSLLIFVYVVTYVDFTFCSHDYRLRLRSVPAFAFVDLTALPHVCSDLRLLPFAITFLPVVTSHLPHAIHATIFVTIFVGAVTLVVLYSFTHTTRLRLFTRYRFHVYVRLRYPRLHIAGFDAYVLRARWLPTRPYTPPTTSGCCYTILVPTFTARSISSHARLFVRTISFSPLGWFTLVRHATDYAHTRHTCVYTRITLALPFYALTAAVPHTIHTGSHLVTRCTFTPRVLLFTLTRFTQIYVYTQSPRWFLLDVPDLYCSWLRYDPFTISCYLAFTLRSDFVDLRFDFAFTAPDTFVPVTLRFFVDRCDVHVDLPTSVVVTRSVYVYVSARYVATAHAPTFHIPTACHCWFIPTHVVRYLPTTHHPAIPSPHGWIMTLPVPTLPATRYITIYHRLPHYVTGVVVTFPGIRDWIRCSRSERLFYRDTLRTLQLTYKGYILLGPHSVLLLALWCRLPVIDFTPRSRYRCSVVLFVPDLHRYVVLSAGDFTGCSHLHTTPYVTPHHCYYTFLLHFHLRWFVYVVVLLFIVVRYIYVTVAVRCYLIVDLLIYAFTVDTGELRFFPLFWKAVVITVRLHRCWRIPFIPDFFGCYVVVWCPLRSPTNRWCTFRYVRLPRFDYGVWYALIYLLRLPTHRTDVLRWFTHVVTPHTTLPHTTPVTIHYTHPPHTPFPLLPVPVPDGTLFVRCHVSPFCPFTTTLRLLRCSRTFVIYCGCICLCCRPWFDRLLISDLRPFWRSPVDLDCYVLVHISRTFTIRSLITVTLLFCWCDLRWFWCYGYTIPPTVPTGWLRLRCYYGCSRWCGTLRAFPVPYVTFYVVTRYYRFVPTTYALPPLQPVLLPAVNGRSHYHCRYYTLPFTVVISVVVLIPVPGVLYTLHLTLLLLFVTIRYDSFDLRFRVRYDSLHHTHATHVCSVVTPDLPLVVVRLRCSLFVTTRYIVTFRWRAVPTLRYRTYIDPLTRSTFTFHSRVGDLRANYVVGTITRSRWYYPGILRVHVVRWSLLLHHDGDHVPHRWTPPTDVEFSLYVHITYDVPAFVTFFVGCRWPCCCSFITFDSPMGCRSYLIWFYVPLAIWSRYVPFTTLHCSRTLHVLTVVPVPNTCISSAGVTLPTRSVVAAVTGLHRYVHGWRYLRLFYHSLLRCSTLIRSFPYVDFPRVASFATYTAPTTHHGPRPDDSTHLLPRQTHTHTDWFPTLPARLQVIVTLLAFDLRFVRSFCHTIPVYVTTTSRYIHTRSFVTGCPGLPRFVCYCYYVHCCSHPRLPHTVTVYRCYLPLHYALRYPFGYLHTALHLPIYPDLPPARLPYGLLHCSHIPVGGLLVVVRSYVAHVLPVTRCRPDYVWFPLNDSLPLFPVTVVLRFVRLLRYSAVVTSRDPYHLRTLRTGDLPHLTFCPFRVVPRWLPLIDGDLLRTTLPIPVTFTHTLIYSVYVDLRCWCDYLRSLRRCVDCPVYLEPDWALHDFMPFPVRLPVLLRSWLRCSILTLILRFDLRCVTVVYHVPFHYVVIATPFTRPLPHYIWRSIQWLFPSRYRLLRFPRTVGVLHSFTIWSPHRLVRFTRWLRYTIYHVWVLRSPLGPLPFLPYGIYDFVVIHHHHHHVAIPIHYAHIWCLFPAGPRPGRWCVYLVDPHVPHRSHSARCGCLIQLPTFIPTLPLLLTLTCSRYGILFYLSILDCHHVLTRSHTILHHVYVWFTGRWFTDFVGYLISPPRFTHHTSLRITLRYIWIYCCFPFWPRCHHLTLVHTFTLPHCPPHVYTYLLYVSTHAHLLRYGLTPHLYLPPTVRVTTPVGIWIRSTPRSDRYAFLRLIPLRLRFTTWDDFWLRCYTTFTRSGFTLVIRSDFVWFDPHIPVTWRWRWPDVIPCRFWCRWATLLLLLIPGCYCRWLLIVDCYYLSHWRYLLLMLPTLPVTYIHGRFRCVTVTYDAFALRFRVYIPPHSQLPLLRSEDVVRYGWLISHSFGDCSSTIYYDLIWNHLIYYVGYCLRYSCSFTVFILVTTMVTRSLSYGVVAFTLHVTVTLRSRGPHLLRPTYHICRTILR